MDHNSCPARLSAAHGDPRRREAAREDIQQAVQLIALKHHVPETTAFTILVQASVDSRASVRETAQQMVAEARGTD